MCLFFNLSQIELKKMSGSKKRKSRSKQNRQEEEEEEEEEVKKQTVDHMEEQLEQHVQDDTEDNVLEDNVLDVWSAYQPSSINYGKPHPGDIVEVSSLARIKLPVNAYPLAETLGPWIESGDLSSMQLEGIAQACTRHRTGRAWVFSSATRQGPAKADKSPASYSTRFCAAEPNTFGFRRRVTCTWIQK